jgi:hypothetical protein
MKKLLLITVICLVVSVANAATVWSLSGTSGNWNVAGNWNNGVPGTVAPADTKAVLNNGAAAAECQVTDVQTTVNVVIGDGGTGGDVLRIMSGGNLTSTDWFSVGYSRNSQMIVETGGVVSIQGHMWMAAQDAAANNCILDINGGTVNITGAIGLGTVNGSTPSGGIAYVNVNAGTLNLSGLSATGSIYDGSVIDIGLGAIVIDGNVESIVNAYDTADKITAYGGSGTLSVDYDATTSGKTTVTAVSGEKASCLLPVNGDDDASTYSDLSWTAGLYADSHDVYFGTNPNPGIAELQGNQPETTFDPGILNLNTTYYWRVDEVSDSHPDSPWTGDVWSFKTQATSTFGKIVYPWNATTALVKAGDTFEVWFDADPGQVVNSVTLKGPYNTISGLSITQQTDTWVYDKLSGNTCNRLITVTVPTDTPEDRYDLLLNTSYGQAISARSVKVVTDYRSEFYFLHHSDLHMLADGMTNGHPKNLAALSAVIDAANIIGVEVVIASGDNQGFDFDSHFLSTTGQGFDFWYNGHEPAGLKGTLDFDAATLEAQGNHDWSTLEGQDWNGLGHQKATWWNQYAGLVYGNAAYGGARFMTYNNGWMQVAEQIDGNNWYVHQLSQQSQWLNLAGDGNLRVFGYHILPGDSAPDTNAINNFLSSENIGVILYGHWHVNDVINPNNQSGVPAYSSRGMMGSSEPWFNLYKVDSAGNFTWIYQPDAGQPNGLGTSLCPVENRGANFTQWIPKLKIDYASANDGTSVTNTATLTNNFDVGFDAARIRFVMPKGAVYGVSQGTIDQQFNGDSYCVVDVSVDVGANSTAVIVIDPSGLPSGATARGENAPNETADEAFDGDDQTKWLDFSPTGSWIQWHYGGSMAPTVKQYAITSANDFPERDPKDWNLLGSNDQGDTWDVLDSRSGVSFTSRFETQNFLVSSPGAYNIYRLEITAIRDDAATAANCVQLAEFELPACAGLADFNCDGFVGFDDYSYIADVWLTTDPTADIADPFGQVDVLDLLVLTEEWLSDLLIDSAVAYWTFDEASGSVATNTLPGGYDGTLMNMDDSDWVAGVDGNALDFDGVDDYVEVAGYKGITGTASRSCMAWIKTSTVNGSILIWGDTSVNGQRWDLRLQDFGGHPGRLMVSVKGAYRASRQNLADGNWHHVAAVLEEDGTPSTADIKLYIDGVADTDVDTVDYPINTAWLQDVTIGSSVSYFNGLIDDVRIYDRALSVTEIAEIAQ